MSITSFSSPGAVTSTASRFIASSQILLFRTAIRAASGNGGPGYQIRCEINEVPYQRGAVGMALSGKDTGGSQWFVTHSPQPHLDGGYTVFGNVVAGMDVVDNIVRGDVIRSIAITEITRHGARRAVKRERWRPGYAPST